MSTENAQQPNNNPSAGSAKLPVMRRFCVSLVYQKVKAGGILDMALRSAVVEAVSQEEALGVMIMKMTEFENWQLNLKCVVSLDNGA